MTMFMKKISAALVLSLLILPLFAQAPPVKLRIVDLDNVATVIDQATTSSTDEKGNFPVYLNGVKEMKQLNDYYMILVRHDLKASNPDIYISVELIDMDDHSSIFEMARYMRFSGKTEEGTFSIQVKDINTIQVMRKGY